MENEKDKATRYRQRAAQLRAVAQELADQNARKVLLATAEDYETMALEAERSAAVAASVKVKSEPPRDV